MTEPIADDVSPARTAAAGALRRLGHAVVGHQVDDVVFERLTEAIESALPDIEAGAPRSRPVDDLKRRLFETPPGEGESMEDFPGCAAGGGASPLGVRG